MQIDVKVSTDLSRSVRVRQLEAMFDVPATDRAVLEWNADVPIDAEPWNVGLLVGPSGAGKSTILNQCFGTPRELEWEADSVLDDFDEALSMQDIAKVCHAVGFNTIPAWMRPYKVLSTGERFRVSMARVLVEAPPDGLLVVDEFTSVVDRQVAQIGAHAVQKYIRRADRQLVAATCHYDVIDWLQPDWVLEPAGMKFTRRSVQPRPELHVTISQVPYAAWRLFAPYHYLTASLASAAKCFCLFVNDAPAVFSGVLHRPHPTRRARNIRGVSRTVTLPDWQGLGLAYVLNDTLGAAYKALGYRMHYYPAHPSYIRSSLKSPHRKMTQRPARWRPSGTNSTLRSYGRKSTRGRTTQGTRPNAVFAYTGPAMEVADADRLVNGKGVGVDAGQLHDPPWILRKGP